jgi:hypothetical protein
MLFVLPLILLLTAELAPAAAAPADTVWPQFRGVRGRGVSEVNSLPTTWSTTKNVAWKADVPGRSNAFVEEGDTFVLNPGDRYDEIAKNSLGEMALATPAATRDGLFVRTATSLYRIR